MRGQLRKLFNAGVGALPPAVARGFLKAFFDHPNYAERAGFQVYPRVFYNPFPDPAEVDVARLQLPRPLPGINLNVPSALRLTRELAAFAGELESFPHDPRTGSVTWSMTYPSFDTAALYTMIRRLKPRRYIEVGCGYSTRTSTAALAKNLAEGHPCESRFIEPFPGPHLKELKLPGELIVKKVEQVPVPLFQKLEDGDLLFIDTSHILKVQNDVEYELLRILPSLQRGVYVHVHDIFTPYDYPVEWLVGDHPNRGANNEQYALECLISGGDTWEVILPVHLLWREHRSALSALWPGAEDRPAAIYLRKTK